MTKPKVKGGLMSVCGRSGVCLGSIWERSGVDLGSCSGDNVGMCWGCSKLDSQVPREKQGENKF